MRLCAGVCACEFACDVALIVVVTWFWFWLCFGVCVFFFWLLLGLWFWSLVCVSGFVVAFLLFFLFCAFVWFCVVVAGCRGCAFVVGGRALVMAKLRIVLLLYFFRCWIGSTFRLWCDLCVCVCVLGCAASFVLLFLLRPICKSLFCPD